jgi:hypothetical protein
MDFLEPHQRHRFTANGLLEREPGAIIADLDKVTIKRDASLGAFVLEEEVDHVRDKLADHMLDCRRAVHITEVHARAFANNVQPLQDLNGVLVVLVLFHVRPLLLAPDFMRRGGTNNPLASPHKSDPK